MARVMTEVWVCDHCGSLIADARTATEPVRVRLTVQWIEGGDALQSVRDIGHVCDVCLSIFRGPAAA